MVGLSSWTLFFENIITFEFVTDIRVKNLYFIYVKNIWIEFSICVRFVNHRAKDRAIGWTKKLFIELE